MVSKELQSPPIIIHQVYKSQDFVTITRHQLPDIRSFAAFLTVTTKMYGRKVDDFTGSSHQLAAYRFLFKQPKNLLNLILNYPCAVWASMIYVSR